MSPRSAPAAPAPSGADTPRPKVKVGRPYAARVERVFRELARQIDGMELPAIEKISESQKEDPFQILIATLLSARTQDATTLAASTRLFKRARTPRTMAALSLREIERLFYPVSFYRNKAEHVKACCEPIRNAENTFKAVALEWHEKQLARWTPTHAQNVTRRMEVDIFPYIGNRPIADIDAPELLGVLRRIEARGALDSRRG